MIRKAPLAIGDLTTCQKSYTVTQVDVDSDRIFSFATAGGNGFTSRLVVTTLNLAAGLLTLEKTADRATFSLPGDQIDYQYRLGNDGDAAIDSPFTVEDDRLGTINNCDNRTLASSEDVFCTAAYTVTRADVDAGLIVNRAVASGSGLTSPEAILQIPLATGSLSLDVSSDKSFFSSEGEKIVFTYAVRNASDVPMAGPFTVNDDGFGAIAPCGSGPLLPGELATCHETHTVTAADVENDAITYTATAGGNGATSPPALLTVGGFPDSGFLSMMPVVIGK